MGEETRFNGFSNWETWQLSLNFMRFLEDDFGEIIKEKEGNVKRKLNNNEKGELLELKIGKELEDTEDVKELIIDSFMREVNWEELIKRYSN
ncbi:hypothetical protein LCGC14_3005170 [marine sediment metagenome]|uniref:Uncharacterized protein n=1 Tax=marine sediment metagenome TaxID=412755 RepID=A0A0F8WZV2_9ZZZZ